MQSYINVTLTSYLQKLNITSKHRMFCNIVVKSGSTFGWFGVATQPVSISALRYHQQD